VHRDIQVETYKMNKLNNLVTANQLLNTVKKQYNETALVRELDIEPDDLEEYDAMQDVNNKITQGLMANQMANGANDSDSKANTSNAKRTEQQSTIAKRGTKPSGVGKEMNEDADIEYKEIIGAEQQEVDRATFIKLYNQDKIYHPGMPPRIFMRSNPELTSFIFKSSDFVYRYTTKTAEVTANDLFFMNLGDNIYRL
jgi:hypothetical protein